MQFSPFDFFALWDLIHWEVLRDIYVIINTVWCNIFGLSVVKLVVWCLSQFLIWIKYTVLFIRMYSTWKLCFRAEIANHLGTKSAKDCEFHYCKHYINDPESPLPGMQLYYWLKCFSYSRCLFIIHLQVVLVARTWSWWQLGVCFRWGTDTAAVNPMGNLSCGVECIIGSC